MKIEFTNCLPDIMEACAHRPKDFIQPGHFLGGPILLALLPMIVIEMLWIAANARNQHVSGVSGVWSWLNNWYGEKFVQGILLVLILVLSWVGIRFTPQPAGAYEIWRRNRYLRKPQTIGIAEEGVEYSRRGSAMRYEWKEIRHHALTPNNLVLYLDRGFLVIPKRSFLREDDLRVAEAIISRYCRISAGGFPVLPA